MKGLRSLALAACLASVGMLAACLPEDAADYVKEAGLPTAKAIAGKVVTNALAGDTKARDMVLVSLGEYCDRISPKSRDGFRMALAIDGRPAVTVDCEVVHALAPPDGPSSLIIEPPSDRRALALSREAGASRAGQG